MKEGRKEGEKKKKRVREIERRKKVSLSLLPAPFHLCSFATQL